MDHLAALERAGVIPERHTALRQFNKAFKEIAGGVFSRESLAKAESHASPADCLLNSASIKWGVANAKGRVLPVNEGVAAIVLARLHHAAVYNYRYSRRLPEGFLGAVDELRRGKPMPINNLDEISRRYRLYLFPVELDGHPLLVPNNPLRDALRIMTSAEMTPEAMAFGEHKVRQFLGDLRPLGRPARDAAAEFGFARMREYYARLREERENQT